MHFRFFQLFLIYSPKCQNFSTKCSTLLDSSLNLQQEFIWQKHKSVAVNFELRVVTNIHVP